MISFSDSFSALCEYSLLIVFFVGKCQLFTDPDSKSRNIPEVVLEGAGQLRFWEFGGEGWVG